MASMLAAPMAIAAEEATENADTQVVYGTELSRYEFDEAESVTGFNADIDELPRTVQVLPEQLILDQNANNLTDVLVNAAGVTRAHGFGGTEAQVNIRGFLNNHIFVDGNPVSNRHNIDVANIESAEVILGPASVLHGQVSPGGLVNIITKKPQKESANSIQAELDEHGKRKLTIDSTGSLSDTLQYRLVVSGEDSETFRQVTTTDGTFDSERKGLTVAPSLSYTPDEQNTFTLRFSHTEQELPIDRGTVAIDDGSGNLSIAELPVERRLGSEFDIRDSKEDMVQFDWDHELDNGWTNRFKIGYYEKTFDDYQTRPRFGTLGTPADLDNETLIAMAGLQSGSVQANGLLGRLADSNIDVTESDLFLSDSITGDYTLAGIDNTLYVGGNYYRRNKEHSDGVGLISTPAPLQGLGLLPFMPDLNMIDINSPTQSANRRIDQTVVSHSDETAEEFGLSVQNLAYLTDRLNVLLGLRYDRYDLDKTNTTFYRPGPVDTLAENSLSKLSSPDVVDIDSSNDNISGQAGALYRLTDELSVYASYSESFTPNYPDVTAGVASFTGDLAPEEAKQYEVGVKSSLMDDKLRLTASVYKLQRKNVMKFEDLVARLNGEEQTKGVDLSATMQFVPGLNVLASYSYMDTEIVDDNDATKNNEGNTPFSVPDNKARVWGSYEFQGGNLAGLGFGLGAEYVDERFGNDANTFKLPGYTIYDAAAWYYIPVGSDSKLRLQAGVKNLTDKTYYPANGSGNAYRINVGDPRTVYLTARLEF
ncbi:TonB-dependent siderophore receptor [Marinobacterium jannaschii]|uniref:TonB-dependent siderophore receptor n=1 Tax=Marinobacterium jannaschii TaxID=64970 RepID=UPI001FDFE710|nr:TonB-dependent siderophore receptor [Marinobacterium jannaschii]